MARDVGELYSARVPVADRSPAELSRGAAAALNQVLVKLIGDRQVVGGASLNAVRGQASKFMLQYGYEVDTADNALTLVAKFDERGLAGELGSRGVATWGKERPDTLVWLVAGDDVERRISSGDEPGMAGAMLLARAQNRGIPILFPVQDIQEAQRLLNAADWSTLVTDAGALSARYGTPAVMIAHLRQSETGAWQLRWKVQLDDGEFESNVEAQEAETALSQAVDALADALARRYAQSALATNDKLTLTVVGVQTAADYARLSNYLGSLDTVSDLFLRSVDLSAVRFELSARGGRAALAQSIAFGRMLTPVATQPDTWQLLR